MSGTDLHRGTYSGQFGFVFVEGGSNPGNFDQELFLAFRDWEPFFSDQDSDDNMPDPSVALPEAPPTPDNRPNGWEVGYRIFSVNDKSLGGGEPIRVKPGQDLEYGRALAESWRKAMEENKKNGIILSYKILAGPPANRDDFSHLLMIEFPNFAALDERDKFDATVKRLFGRLFRVKFARMDLFSLSPTGRNHEPFTSSPRVHTHRIVGGYRHHRHSGGDSAARAGARTGGGPPRLLRKQPEADGHRLQNVCE
jgi:hypothetical protein